MTSSDIGYIEVLFEEESKRGLLQELKDIYSESDLYYSDVVPRIAGDVTDTLHLTLDFGILSDQVDIKNINTIINTIHLTNISLGNLNLWQGYQNLYQILVVDVLDSNGSLTSSAKKFANLPHEKEPQFKPHVTLAYVKPDFVLPYNTLEFNKLSVSKIKYSKL